MVKATALFGHPENPDAFEEYSTPHPGTLRKLAEALDVEPRELVGA
jgi:hypothetical protein